jgi:Icc-related predicted phosphoesterase
MTSDPQSGRFSRTPQHVTRVVCGAGPGGSLEAIEALLNAAEAADAHALALVGDLQSGSGDDELSSLFKVLARAGLPTYWVPGPGDAPVERFLRESANIEVVAPFLHGVHGTAAFAGAHVVFAGFGGEVSDDPAAPRDEAGRLSYPRWEPEYRLKVIREFDEHQLVMIFATPPTRAPDDSSGSEVLAELVGTYRPRLVVTGGEQRQGLIGRSLIVAPGSLRAGDYAIVDLQDHSVNFDRLATAAASV